MTSTNMPNESGIRRARRRAVRVGAAASGVAVVLGCLAAAPALAAPNEPRQVHAEGHLLPVKESPGAYRVTGGLVGTYKLRTDRVINAWTYFGTQIREIAGTGSITGCVDQNQNQRCDADEPSGAFRLTFTRVASVDTASGRLLQSRGTHQIISGGAFSGGALTMRDIPIGNSNEILSTYQGDLKLNQPYNSPEVTAGE
jgi:hypothetical protein